MESEPSFVPKNGSRRFTYRRDARAWSAWTVVRPACTPGKPQTNKAAEKETEPTTHSRRVAVSVPCFVATDVGFQSPWMANAV